MVTRVVVRPDGNTGNVYGYTVDIEDSDEHTVHVFVTDSVVINNVILQEAVEDLLKSQEAEGFIKGPYEIDYRTYGLYEVVEVV